MGTNTPALDYGQCENYLKTHLFNELRWLLSAATERSIQDQLKLETPGLRDGFRLPTRPRSL